MSLVKEPMGEQVSDGVSAGGLDGPQLLRKWPIHYASVEPIAVVIDLATIVVVSVVSGLSYHLQDPATSGDIGKSLGSAILVSALFISLMKLRRMYRPIELMALRNQIRAVCLAWTSVFLLLAGTVFALKIGSEFSRGASMLFAMFGLFALICHRCFLRDMLAKGLAERRFSGRKIVLIVEQSHIGDAGLGNALRDCGLRVQGYFSFPSQDAVFGERERIVSRIVEQTRGSDVKEIVIGADPRRWPELRSFAAELRVLPFPVSFIPLGEVAEFFRRPSHELGDTVCVELQRGPLTSFEQTVKRCIDVLFAGIGLMLFLPLLAIVAVAIKFDSPGPVLFRQTRCGFNGRCFTICKFRTMSVLEDGPSIIQAQFADKRVTRLGAWLRRTSIDELPQLLNVLEGSMSLVGPRPHAVVHDNEFDNAVQNYAFRRRVKPGLTGWAQIHGYRGPTPTVASIEGRVEYDLWYIDNWTLTLDLAILLQTPLAMLLGRNAC
jgi:putative colanic acid biosynthesis UDP-glucose lipid carrier transferase